MLFGAVYLIVSFTTLIIACVLNTILMRIAYKRRERIGFYSYFTYAFAIVDILYALAFTTAHPFWHAAKGVFAYFSIAPWNANVIVVQVAFHAWLALFVAIGHCNHCSFMYRYGLVNSRFIVSMFERPNRCIIVVLVMILIYALTVFTAYNLQHDSEEVRELIQQLFGDEFRSDFAHFYMFTVNLNNEDTRLRSQIATAIFFAIIEIQPLAMVYSGWRIHQTVKARAMSEKLKKIHIRAVKMLIAQTLNPMILFSFPTAIDLVGMFTNIDFGELPRLLVLFYALFPIFNPIIIIYFTEDYKRYILGQSSSVSIPSQTQAALSSHTISVIRRRKGNNKNAIFVI